MLFSSSYLLAALSLAASVSAVPAVGAGAAYLMTNDPSGNQILSINIAANGELSGVTVTSTGGLGLHGISNPITNDGLFSQGSVKVNAAAKILVTVNPGSNTVSMFKIDPINPTKLALVGKPVSSNGEFPMSLAINTQGTMVCVLNGGAVNSVSCFKTDLKSGLIPMPNTLRSLGISQTTPPSGPPGSASHLIFSEDERTLIASVKGVPPVPGFLATWAIAPDGSLSSESVKSPGGNLTFAMNVIPGTNAFLVADAGIGFDIFNFGREENSLKATSSIFPIPGQGSNCWVSFNSKTGNFFLSDDAGAIVNEVHVDENLKGTVVRQYPQTPGSQTIDNDIATIGDNNFLFVLAAGTTSVNVFNINIAGKAETVQNFNFTPAAQEAGVTPEIINVQGMATFII